MFGTPLWIELISLQEFEATRGLSITPVAQDPSSSPHATSPGSASACGVAGEGSKQQSLPSTCQGTPSEGALGADPQARGRNATALAVANPIAGLDARISFEEDDHSYFIDGVLFEGPSVTSLASQSFAGEKFNGPAIIERYLPRWRADPDHKYHNAGTDGYTGHIATQSCRTKA